MEKEFEIAGCISEVPDDMSCDEFIDIFIDFIESKNWLFGGGFKEIIDGYYINVDGTKSEHILDADLKELLLQGNKKDAIKLYIELTGLGEKEAKNHIDNLNTHMWGNNMKKLIDFLEKLEENKICYKLDKIRDDYILVEIAVPGERWEVEFSTDGDVVVERFKSYGDVEDEQALEYLFENFSD